MKNRPIHENLDTSFVNLSALLRYLRRRQFDGSVRIELSGYEADIVLTADNQIKVREYDQIAGRIGEGEQALQRILIRAREPGGIIHVYQNVVEAEVPVVRFVEPVIEKAEPIAIIEEPIPVEPEPEPAPVPKPESVSLPSIPKGPSFVAKPPTNGGGNGNGNGHAKHILADLDLKPGHDDKPVINLPDFPFELTNRVEEKARKTQLPAAEWQMLLNLTAELLRTIDNALANADLDFTAAFKKARTEIACDYPFFDPGLNTFSYDHGKIRITEQIGAKLFASGITSSLRRIFDKLAANDKFRDTHRYTVQKVSALVQSRKAYYDRFYITPQLEKIIGA